jgi:N-acetyl-gamma-glutamyl-phosphate reductase
VKKIGIVGGTGYAGVELLRILASHPAVNVHKVTSRAHAGTRVDVMFSNLRGYYDIEFSDPNASGLAECDLVFFATPNGIAMKHAPKLLAQGVKVIDLSADYRINDVGVWGQWYGMEHASPDLIKDAVYGLPEINREQIQHASLVANPGCYPTAVSLGMLPLLESKLINANGIIADCKSGASGAGRGAAVATLLAEASDNFKAYGVAGHRHLPEISQTLSLAANEPVELTFVPHLLPMIRGIHATLYVETISDQSQQDLQMLFEERYAQEAFVDIMPIGSHPETRSVKSSNLCRIAVHRLSHNRVVVLSVIDNLVKGAAGQAIQNMNLMLGLDEGNALQTPALLP